MTFLIGLGAYSFALTLSGKEVAESELVNRYTTVVQPFVESYCIKCHGKEKPKADFDLSHYASMAAVVRDSEHWDLVVEKLQSAEMPPKNGSHRHQASTIR